MPRNVLGFLFAAIVWALHNALLLLACPSVCSCRWKNGKEMAKCTNQGLMAIPDGIDSSTQVVDLTGNNLRSLPSQAFLRAKLLNLQRIYISDCRLAKIHPTAFGRLTNLVELDLSINLLSKVPSDAFRDFHDLRRLSLSGNPIRRIESNAFVNLTSLTSLELNQCHIESVTNRAFAGLANLTQLKLNGNQLHVIHGSVLLPLVLLNSVELHDNPWHCDCQLRDLHKWLIKKKIHYPSPLVCDQPPLIKGTALDHMLEGNLACEPTGPISQKRVEAYDGDEAILVCRVAGNPEPQIQWIWQGRTITNFSYVYPRPQLYYIRESGSLNKTSVLRITAVSQRNSGQYKCIAENPGGKFTSTITLRVMDKPEDLLEPHIGQVIGIFIAVMTFTMVIVVMCVLIIRHKDFRGKYAKYLALYRVHKSFASSGDGRHDDSNANSELQALKISSTLKSSNKRPCSPDAMTFLVNDFGVPRSSYLNRMDNKPDVVHINKSEPPTRQGPCNNGSNNNRVVEASKRNDMKPDQLLLMDKIDNPIKDNKDDEANTAVDEEQQSLCMFEENKSSSKCNLELDKLNWKESFSSSNNDFEEEIEMKVQFDHLSAESKWKSNLSLSKYATSNNEWPIRSATDLMNGSDWLGEDPADFKCKGYEPLKYTNQEPWWSSSHDLSDDNSFNICMYDKPSTTCDNIVDIINDVTTDIIRSESLVFNANTNINNPPPEMDSCQQQQQQQQQANNVSPETYPFASFLYDSRETDL